MSNWLKLILKNLQITNITISTINETERPHISFYFYTVRQVILRLWSYWLDFTLFTIKWSFMNLSTTKNWKKKSLANLELGKQLLYILFYDSNVHYLHHGFYMYIHKVNITHTALCLSGSVNSLLLLYNEKLSFSYCIFHHTFNPVW